MTSQLSPHYGDHDSREQSGLQVDIPNMIEPHRNNNFHLLRLAAAAIVAIMHLGYFHLLHDWTAAVALTPNAIFSGVLTFFVISGFLVTQSWQRCPNIHYYALSRFLRIYPAFLVAVAFTGLIAFSFTSINISWLFDTLTVFFLYHTPKSLLPFGNGMPNGALWTIPVEVQFYLLIPLLFYIARRRLFWLNAITVALILLSAALQLFHDFGVTHHPDLRHGILHNFWAFGFGVLMQLNWKAVCPYLLRQAPTWITIHMLNVFAASFLNDGVSQLVVCVTLAPAIISISYASPGLTRSTIGDTDISYGLYLYHSPILHMLRAFHVSGLAALLLTGVASVTAALMSWYLIERPCLNAKRYLLRRSPLSD